VYITERVLCAALSDESLAGGGVLRLGDIALALQGDWLMVAPQIGITSPEVIKIQKEYGSVTEQVSLYAKLISGFLFSFYNCQDDENLIFDSYLGPECDLNIL